jgi:hypothetical protein
MVICEQDSYATTQVNGHTFNTFKKGKKVTVAGYLSKMQNGRHKQMSGQHILARQKKTHTNISRKKTLKISIFYRFEFSLLSSCAIFNVY